MLAPIYWEQIKRGHKYLHATDWWNISIIERQCLFLRLFFVTVWLVSLWFWISNVEIISMFGFVFLLRWIVLPSMWDKVTLKHWNFDFSWGWDFEKDKILKCISYRKRLGASDNFCASIMINTPSGIQG